MQGDEEGVTETMEADQPKFKGWVFLPPKLRKLHLLSTYYVPNIGLGTKYSLFNSIFTVLFQVSVSKTPR